MTAKLATRLAELNMAREVNKSYKLDVEQLREKNAVLEGEVERLREGARG